MHVDVQKQQGYDIADYLIDSYKEKLTLESSLLDQMIKKNPALNTLIENLELVHTSSL